MARHLMLLADDGTVESTLMDFVEARLVRQLEARPIDRAGLYRVTCTSHGGRPHVTVGARIANPERELARLRTLGAEGVSGATTAMPGVAGFQEACTASTAAAQVAKSRTRELASWLAERLG